MRPPPAQDDGSSEEYYYDEYSETESEDGPPQNASRPPTNRGGPPGLSPTPSRKPPPLPNGPPVPSKGPSRPPSKNKKQQQESDEYYDSYYDYDYQYEYDDVYEYDYDYDEIYEYEYEYDDEEGDDDRPPIARPKGGLGGALGGSGPLGLSADMLGSARNGLVKAQVDDRPKIDPVASRPFGLTSTKLSQLRSGMTKVKSGSGKGEINQQDFRGNLRPATGGGSRGGVNVPRPDWMNPNLKKGARPMTTNIQTVNTADIRAKAQAAKERAAGRGTGGPRFMNGVPIGRTSVKRFRAKNGEAGGPGGPPAGRVSAKIALDRKQDPNNPNRFLTKQRVSYRVRKKVEGPPGAPGAPGGRGPSIRVKRRVPSARIGGRGQSSRMRGQSSRMRGQSSRMSKRGKSSRMSKRGKSSRMSKRGQSRRMGPNGELESMRRKRVSKNPGKVSRRFDPSKATDPNRVSRRRRKPNVSRASTNMNILGAKTKPVDVPGVGLGDGCYLKFDAANGGVLYAQWTVIGYERNEALAFFKPATPVPRINYRKNEGRSDLLSNITGDFRQYAEAWTFFFGMAKEFDGTVSVLDQTKQSDFAIELVGLAQDLAVTKIDTYNEVSLKYWLCIACLPGGSSAFDGAEKVNADFFMNTASREGYAVRLS